MNDDPLPSGDDAQEPPPILGSWRNVYALVLASLVATVLLLYALARWAA